MFCLPSLSDNLPVPPSLDTPMDITGPHEVSEVVVETSHLPGGSITPGYGATPTNNRWAEVYTYSVLPRKYFKCLFLPQIM